MANAQLSPPAGFQQSVQATGSALSSIDTDCKNIISLPTDENTIPIIPTIGGVDTGLGPQVSPPDISTDMTAVKATFNDWFSTVRPQIVASLQGIITFNGNFQNVYANIYPIAQQIAAGNMSQVPQFKNDLGTLQTATQTQQTQAKQVQNALIAYLVEVSKVQVLLSNDNTTLQNSIPGMNQQVADLQQAIDELNEKIEIEQFIPFSTIIEALTGELENNSEQLSDLNDAIDSTKQQIQYTQNAINLLNNYQSSFGSIQSSINSLANSWEALESDLGETIADENISDFNAFTPALVQAASADWQVVTNLAKTFI